MARVLIFGGTGFIGSHLAQYCLACGDDVSVAARPGSNPWRLAGLRQRVAIHTAALPDRTALLRLFDTVRPDHVFYLAAQTRRPPEPDFSDAAGGINEDLSNLLSVLATAASSTAVPGALVRAGSLAEYGNGPAPYVESQREKPLNAYAATMTAGTHFAQMLQPRLPYPVINARLALCYGPGQSNDFLIPTLIDNCRAGRPTVLRRPNDRRDLIYVKDVVAGLRRLAEARLPGGTVINLATGVAPTMTEVAEHVVRALGVRQDLIVCDESPVQPDTTPFLCGSAALARELSGWVAETSFAEGLRLTVNMTKESANTVMT